MTLHDLRCSQSLVHTGCLDEATHRVLILNLKSSLRLLKYSHYIHCKRSLLPCWGTGTVFHFYVMQAIKHGTALLYSLFQRFCECCRISGCYSGKLASLIGILESHSQSANFPSYRM